MAGFALLILATFASIAPFSTIASRTTSARERASARSRNGPYSDGAQRRPASIADSGSVSLATSLLK